MSRFNIVLNIVFLRANYYQRCVLCFTSKLSSLDNPSKKKRYHKPESSFNLARRQSIYLAISVVGLRNKFVNFFHHFLIKCHSTEICHLSTINHSMVHLSCSCQCAYAPSKDKLAFPLCRVHFPSSHLATQVSENVFLSLCSHTEPDSGKQGDSWVVWKETPPWIPIWIMSENCLNVSQSYLVAHFDMCDITMWCGYVFPWLSIVKGVASLIGMTASWYEPCHPTDHTRKSTLSMAGISCLVIWNNWDSFN